MFWALLVTVFVYRSLSWEHFLKACAKACKTTGVVLFLIGISAAFGYFMALYEVPQKTGELMKSISSEPWVIFLMINVLLFVLGTFLDMAATILICTPIFLPIAVSFGMDPVQFGIMMLINCALGLNTPPVGTTQFVGCAIGGISVGEVMKSILPFYGALIAALMLVTYVPAFSLWLPSLFNERRDAAPIPTVAFTRQPRATPTRRSRCSTTLPQAAAVQHRRRAAGHRLSLGRRAGLVRRRPLPAVQRRPGNRIYRWDECSGATSVFRQPSNNANGHARDRRAGWSAAST